MESIIYDFSELAAKNATEIKVNKYISNSDDGMVLIGKILSGNSRPDLEKNIRTANILKSELLGCLAGIGLENELLYYEKLLKISEKLSSYENQEVINSKIIVAIGGKFSAGKSCFINSIFGNDVRLLPEEQNPTTSIPTFVISGNEKSFMAVVNDTAAIKLDEEEMQALTHKFYDKYKFGFNQFIDKLILTIETFPYKNIALLDTPGYSKDDSGVRQNVSDEGKALSQLRTADYIIWLVDCENGTVHQKDIEFIKRVAPEKKVLFIFNKCDKKTDREIEDIIKHAKQTLTDAEVLYEDVVSYSSVMPEEYDKRKKISKFLKRVNKIKKDNTLSVLLNTIIDGIRKDILDLQSRKKVLRSNVIKSINSSYDPIKINGCVYLLKNIERDIEVIEQKRKAFERKWYNVKNLLSERGL